MLNYGNSRFTGCIWIVNVACQSHIIVAQLILFSTDFADDVTELISKIDKSNIPRYDPWCLLFIVLIIMMLSACVSEYVLHFHSVCNYVLYKHNIFLSVLNLVILYTLILLSPQQFYSHEKSNVSEVSMHTLTQYSVLPLPVGTARSLPPLIKKATTQPKKFWIGPWNNAKYLLEFVWKNVGTSAAILGRTLTNMPWIF
jgi:hypothetical protein